MGFVAFASLLKATPSVILCEWGNRRLSVFTPHGDFVHCVGVGSLNRPLDAERCHTGDVLAVDCDDNRICVFAGKGNALLGTFGGVGIEAQKLASSRALSHWR